MRMLILCLASRYFLLLLFLDCEAADFVFCQVVQVFCCCYCCMCVHFFFLLQAEDVEFVFGPVVPFFLGGGGGCLGEY